MKARLLTILPAIAVLLAGCISVELVDNSDAAPPAESQTLTSAPPAEIAAEPTWTPSFDPPTPTPTWTPPPYPIHTPVPATPTPLTEAERIAFTPGTSVIQLQDRLSGSKRYVFRAFADQVTTVAVFPKGIQLSVWGQDGNLLKGAEEGRSFWRGTLPASQDYFIEISLEGELDYDLTLVVHPPGETVQWIGYRNDSLAFELLYPDYFVSELVTGFPMIKSTGVFRLEFVDSPYFRGTNLSEVMFLAGGSADAGMLARCTEPASEAEQYLGTETIGSTEFHKSITTGIGLGHIYDRIIYRTVQGDVCYEIVFLIHYTSMGVYDPALGIKEFDRQAILEKLEQVLATIQFG